MYVCFKKFRIAKSSTKKLIYATAPISLHQQRGFMVQVLHARATTTIAIRKKIQQSQKGVHELAK
jgi:uncharacterized protein (DUF1778 family)